MIDLVCYRRRGHNEAEEPMKTQPLMYQAIRQHPTPRAIYAGRLAEEGRDQRRRSGCARRGLPQCASTPGEHVAMSLVHEPDEELFVDWRPYLGHEWTTPADTRVDLAHLQELARRVNTVPDGFAVHRQVQRLHEDRRAHGCPAPLPSTGGFAETMAYATLLDQGHAVRLTGQDTGVGTFSHRHAVVYNQKSRRGLRAAGTSTRVAGRAGIRSLRFAVVGGSRARVRVRLRDDDAERAGHLGGAVPETSPTCAQVVKSTSSSPAGETKSGRASAAWSCCCPHGYEGQGPEHSSARLERYLQLCAEHNIQVCLPTTPAQMFHMLRRQVLRPLRKPLVALTPKSLLRHNKLAVSSLEESR